MFHNNSIFTIKKMISPPSFLLFQTIFHLLLQSCVIEAVRAFLLPQCAIFAHLVESLGCFRRMSAIL